MKSSTLVVVVLLACVLAVQGWKPMSRCKAARATWYESAIGTNQYPAGTCGFGTVADDMPLMFQNGYVSAPDDETYNQAKKYITSGGLGWGCGECFEISGPVGKIYVMASDVCDSSQSNCKGSQNRDYPDFNINGAVWGQLYADNDEGSTTINFRKVSCDMGSKNISLYFDKETDHNPYYFKFRFYNYQVGIRGAKILQNGVWTTLKRDWTNAFIWQKCTGDACTAVTFPFQLQVTGVTGEVVTFGYQFQQSNLIPGKRIKFTKQFAAPADGFGGSSPASCKWAGPSPTIYSEGFGTQAKIPWVDWGSWGGAEVNANYEGGCYSGGNCIAAYSLKSGAGIQFGNSNSFPPSFFKNVTFAAKVSTGTVSGIKLLWDCGESSSNQYTLPAITTTWKLITIPTSTWTISENCFKVLKFIGAGNTNQVLYLDSIELKGAAKGTGPMTGWTECSTFTSSPTCTANFWCSWKSSACVNTPS